MKTIGKETEYEKNERKNNLWAIWGREVEGVSFKAKKLFISISGKTTSPKEKK